MTESVIARQCNAIVHRGPDDFGYFVDGDFGFGARRLSIIDPAHGHQPISTPDDRYTIAFNGEICNHLELRRELAGEGAVFRTHSDTETVLAAFVHWGDAAWPRLDGMFAVAIWDRGQRQLTLARDPLGIKPLYLTRQQGGLAFASEIRALRVLPDHDFELDERAVHDFFSFGHVQRPRTFFRQVHSLDPGHLLHFGPTGDGEVRAFWRPRFQVRHDLSADEWIEETRARVQQTVSSHMLADVPVGVFLSGGVDSSAIAAAMRHSSSGSIKAFTIGFPGTAIDETAAAGRIARHLGLEHIVLPLEPAAAGDLLPEVQSAFDEPCAATAAVPIWHLSKLAAQHVKVVLCGEGSDEIFAGYKRQRTAVAAARWRPLMQVLGPVAALLEWLPDSHSHQRNYLRHNALRFRDSALLANNFQRFFAGTQITTPQVRARIYSGEFRRRQELPRPFAALQAEYFGAPEFRHLNPLQQFMLAEITVHMPGSLLNRLDRASMTHSLEARVPFLSHQFVDWCLTMPDDMKLRGHSGKYALRKAIEPWLPSEALSKRKQGFQLPFAEWFKAEFSTFAQEAWMESGAVRSGFLSPSAVNALFAEHTAGKANHGRILYAIAMFGCWWEQNWRGGMTHSGPDKLEARVAC